MAGVVASPARQNGCGKKEGKSINRNITEVLLEETLNCLMHTLPFLHVLLRARDAMPSTFRDIYGVERKHIEQLIELVNKTLTQE